MKKSAAQKDPTAMASAAGVDEPSSPSARPSGGAQAINSMDTPSPHEPHHIQKRRRPHLARVRSESVPTRGCTTMPEMGPASHATPRYSSERPSSWRTGVTLAYWQLHASPIPYIGTVARRSVRRLRAASSGGSGVSPVLELAGGSCDSGAALSPAAASSTSRRCRLCPPRAAIAPGARGRSACASTPPSANFGWILS